MPENADGETVADVLKRKRGAVRQAPLEPGSPSWDDIHGETWAEIHPQGPPAGAGLQDVPEAALGRGVRQMSTQVLPPPAATRADVFAGLLAFLNRLGAAHIPYTVRHSRADALMVEVTVPGERWEIDFLTDGDIDVEVFRSSGGVVAADGRLDDLIRTYGEPPAGGDDA